MTRDELNAAKERFISQGPATSISPLSGPQPEDPVDLDYVYIPDGTTGSMQPRLELEEDGNIVVAPGSTPSASTSTAAASSSGRVKRSSSSELTPCTSDEDDEREPSPVAGKRRKISTRQGAELKAPEFDFHSSSHEGESDDDVLDGGAAARDLKVKDFGAPAPAPSASASAWGARPKRKAALAARGRWAPEDKKGKASVRAEEAWKKALTQEEE